MIVLSIVSYQIDQLKQHIDRKMNHKYVDMYVRRPQIDEFQLELLFQIVVNSELSDPKIKSYLTATTLVQTALNAHDRVPVEDEFLYDDHQKKEKQLLILAGDYYSGLYYLLLSEIKDMDMIRALAQGIKMVNEKKMQLYYSEYDTYDELIQLLLSIHSTIIDQFSSRFLSAEASSVIQKIVHLHYLCKEEKKLNTEAGTIIQVFSELTPTLQMNVSHHQLLYEIIRKYVQEIEESIQVEQDLPPFLKEFVQRFLTNEVYDLLTIAGEG